MARKRDGNNDDYELEQMSRAELARLQRQYRIMEGDREAYSEEVSAVNSVLMYSSCPSIIGTGLFDR